MWCETGKGSTKKCILSSDIYFENGFLRLEPVDQILMYTLGKTRLIIDL